MRTFIQSIVTMLFMLTLVSLAAQTRGHEIQSENKHNKIAMHRIVGDWCSHDSSSVKISFVEINNDLVNIEGIKHGVGNYMFQVIGDSISVNGSAANWPPYDCTLRLINRNELEISFYQYFHTATKVIFKRCENQ